MGAVIAEIPWGDAETLRSEMLGWPPGPVPGDVDPSAKHLAVVDDAHGVVGVVSCLPYDCPDLPGEAAVYLWGMAVATAQQRKGHGSALLAEVRRRAAEARAVVVWADARETAVPFYVRHGARLVGRPYIDDVTGLIDRRVVLDAEK